MAVTYEGYGVVNGHGNDPNEAQQMLIDNMLRHMKQGWIPQGGICFVMNVSADSAVFIYSQAVVRPASGTDV